jgi:hypothetical protein
MIATLFETSQTYMSVFFVSKAVHDRSVFAFRSIKGSAFALGDRGPTCGVEPAFALCGYPRNGGAKRGSGWVTHALFGCRSSRCAPSGLSA